MDVEAPTGQLAYPPKSDNRTEITQLAYLHSFDAVQNKNYVCLVYKEESRKTGEWKLKVDLKGMRVTAINPDSSSLRRNLAKAAADGREYLVTGYQIEPSEDDPRLLENRIFFDEAAQPQSIEIHLVTRNADGSPTERQVVAIDWPAGNRSEAGKRFVSLPKSTFSHSNEELAYVDSYDVIANHHYAYLAYKRTHVKTGKWELRIVANGTSGTSIDSEDATLVRRIQAAVGDGKDYVVLGVPLATKDARMAETRLYFDETLTPSHGEIHLVTRKADGSPMEKQVARFAWPALVPVGP